MLTRNGNRQNNSLTISRFSEGQDAAAIGVGSDEACAAWNKRLTAFIILNINCGLSLSTVNISCAAKSAYDYNAYKYNYGAFLMPIKMPIIIMPIIIIIGHFEWL